MGLVAAVHAAALLLIANSLGIVPPLLEESPPDIETTVIERTPPPDLPPPDTQPPLVEPKLFLPLPEVPPVDIELPPPPITQELRPPQDIEIGPGSAEPRPVLTSVGMDSRHPLSQPAYPPERIRNQDEGAVDLQVYVLPTGRVGDARVLKSSGFDDFDRAALQEARRNWRLKPATRDGQPVAQWYSLRVVFKLKNQR